MSAYDTLRDYLVAAGVSLTDEEFTFLQSAFVPATVRADGYVQRAGEVATHGAFVASGCMRVYVLDEKGKEHILQFVPERWWWSDMTSLMTRTPSQYYFQAIEDSELLRIDPPSHQRLLDRIPAFAASFRTGLQRHAAAKDQRIVSGLSASAEDRYEGFVAMYPSIVQRVPQWMLASYLGVTPETLSRIRRNRARRPPSGRPASAP